MEKAVALAAVGGTKYIHLELPGRAVRQTATALLVLGLLMVLRPEVVAAEAGAQVVVTAIKHPALVAAKP
jgi:hypothetical protein